MKRKAILLAFLERRTNLICDRPIVDWICGIDGFYNQDQDQFEIMNQPFNFLLVANFLKYRGMNLVQRLTIHLR